MKKLILSIIILLLLQSTCLAENLIVQTAIAELGNGEIGRNNAGLHVKRYTRGRDVEWCAGFVSYVLDRSNVHSLKYSCSVLEIYNDASSKNMLTDDPQPGDLIAFYREGKDSWKGHIGIIEKVDDTYIYTIEGNVGKFPAVVKRCKHNKSNMNGFLGYIRTN